MYRQTCGYSSTTLIAANYGHWKTKYSLLLYTLNLLKTIKWKIVYVNCHFFVCKICRDQSVRLVCYSPKKRESLQQVFASQSPVKIVGTKKNRKNASVRILRIIAYLSMQELLPLIICPSHSIHHWEIVGTMQSKSYKQTL